MAHFSYQSFCWSIGTTSFRMVDFNKKIEEQLSLLSKFRESIKGWTPAEQVKYYEFLSNEGFITGSAPRPDKDARQKTSGLVAIGLIDNKRNLTDAGLALLKLVENNDFAENNALHIANDSFIYLKQLLKTDNSIGNNIVRPFIVFLYLITKFEYLSKEEFTFLLPLCINQETTEFIFKNISKLRKGKISIDEIIISTLMSMDNYKVAHNFFQDATVNEEVICAIGMNRKSVKYAKPYYDLYNAIRNGNVDAITKATKKLNGKPAAYWRDYLLKGKQKTGAKIYNASNENEFKDIFFQQLHLFKAKSTLDDYYDLNRRYFKTTDNVIFEDEKIILDVIPKCYFKEVKDELISIAFEKSINLKTDVELKDIADFLEINEVKLYADLEKIYGVKIRSSHEANQIVQNDRLKRFNKLIDEKFSINKLIELLSFFEERKDDNIRGYISDNADIPTSFEYILGIIWYLVSEREGNILDYMNLSLEADLLPKSHASGGNADIEYLYDKTTDYPKHTLLIEATLSEDKNQRRMEMEPVSRHLGDYILKTINKNAYCLFISTYLHINVISDFRSRKDYTYYSTDGQSEIKGLKILPLSTNELKMILMNKHTYKSVYKIFDKAYQSDAVVKDWYKKEIREKL